MSSKRTAGTARGVPDGLIFGAILGLIVCMGSPIAFTLTIAVFLAIIWIIVYAFADSDPTRPKRYGK
ncbi:MAG: hypothetical protein WC878_03325 [Candidatus Paceibacterota bacterium]|jgi:hypothetical protein